MAEKKKCILKYSEKSKDLCLPTEIEIWKDFHGHQVKKELFLFSNGENGIEIERIFKAGKYLTCLENLAENAERFGLEKEIVYTKGEPNHVLVYAPYVPEDHPTLIQTHEKMRYFPEGTVCDIELKFMMDDYCRYVVLRLELPGGDKTPLMKAVCDFFTKEFDQLTDEEKQSHFPNDPDFVRHETDEYAYETSNGEYAVNCYDNIGEEYTCYCCNGLKFLETLVSVRLIGVIKKER